MIVRRERGDDVEAIAAVHRAAFAAAEQDDPVEVDLVAALRADPGWVPELSLIAELDGSVVGHVCLTYGDLDGFPVLGLGPIGVLPSVQARGVGSALMHASLGAADALDEPLVVLLGDVGYYSRFGFAAAGDLGIEAPDPQWGEHFQARPLSSWNSAIRGRYRYSAPFENLG